MRHEKSRLSEFLACFVLYEIGSTTLFQMGSEAKQDAWLAMLIGASIGCLLLLIYLTIHHKDPDKDLFQLCKHYFGKFIGTFVALLYAGYFGYEASRNLRDLGELAAFVLLNRTPMLVLITIIILVIMNNVRHGVHANFLLCLLLLPFIILSYMILLSFIASQGLIHFENVYPIMENGMKPIWTSAFPDLISFPFGQTVLFLAFFPMVKRVKNLNKATIITYWLVAIMLTIFNQINVLVLGPTLAQTLTFPLLEVVQLIEILQVFERMDILFVLVMFMGLGTKLCIFYLGAVTGFSHTTGTSFKKWIIPVGIAIFLLSFISPNFTHHLWVGIKVMLDKCDPVFQFGFPILLLLVMLIRLRKVKTNT